MHPVMLFQIHPAIIVIGILAAVALLAWYGSRNSGSGGSGNWW